MVAAEGGVELAQQLLALLVGGADDDAVGVHEVVDRGAFLEELGVGDHVEVQVAAAAAFSVSTSLARPCRVPTGTVVLVTMTLASSMCSAIVRATASTYLRSAEPSSSGGVPTAMKTMRPCLTASAASVVKLSRPSAWFFLTMSSRPGS